MNRIRKFWIFTIVLTIVILTAIIVIQRRYVPESKAEENTGEKINIVFKEGDTKKDSENNILFDDTLKTVSMTISNTLILPGKSFDDVITNIKLNDTQILDNESFYFEKFNSESEKQKKLDDIELWAYSFTGWHIVGTDTYIPQKTVFQPGDPIIPEVLEEQGIIKINEDETVQVLKELELEAVWGKCYFVSDNGSGDNKGNDYKKPYNSINVTTDSNNAFFSAIMLTGNITRKGGIYTSGTIKSLQQEKQKKYELEIYGTGNCIVSRNVRVDNVINTYTTITQDNLQFNKDIQYWEQTARNEGFFGRLYNSASKMITVLYGGEIHNGEWFGYLTSTSIDRVYYFGRNVKCTQDITIGISGNNGEHTGKTIIYITGGEFISYVTMDRNGKNQILSNDKYIYVYGNKSGNSEYDVILPEIYASGVTPIDGNIYISISGCTNITNVFGGGKDYTATIKRDVYLKIKDSVIEGNVNAGGKYGSVDGTANLEVKGSNIKGNVYGSGMGATSISSSNEKAWYGMTKEKATSVVSEPPSDFPEYNEETEEVTMYKISKIGYWSYVGSEGYNTMIDKYTAKLSEAYVGNSNIYMNTVVIGKAGDNNSGNIFGGGADAHVKGSTSVELINCTVYGNVYGGGDGVTKPEEFKICEPLNKNEYTPPTAEDLEEQYKNNGAMYSFQKPDFRYNYGEYYNWSNDISVLNMGGIDKVNKLVYSSNMIGWGDVFGSTTVNIKGGQVYGDVYGGGNSGKVGFNSITEESTGGGSNVIIDNAKIQGNVYAGGNSGKVEGDTKLLVISGTYTNIFGGGNQSYIQGSTDVTIGQENSSNVINVTGLVYGGGRGYDANNDGDASDFTTVYGNSKVLIQGVNTSVENYGSTKLGAVAGNVDVNFKNYWSGNSTAKYQTMNGIDRATTVSFDNSYVLLENKDANGNLVGIQSIENLVIPNGSGLKISANGEIAGNFEGGGELYLDSLVCLTVQGNITGKTTLVLNPKLMENGSQVIKGGINAPYLKVGGTAPEKIALVSGEENRYKIIQANKETVKEEIGEDYIYYYIAEDVIVQNNITVETNSIENRKYKDKITNTNDVLILNTGTFTTDYNISYYLTDDAYKAKDYSNISRKLKLISNTDKEKVIIMPVGTEITMIIDGKYYSYVVNTENLSEISLSDFTNNELSTKYDELKDITNSELVDKSLNEINGTTTYTFKENYKFIINFTNTKGIEVDRYYPSLEVYYGQTSFGDEKKDVANNMVDIQKREYSLDLVNDRTYYEPDKKINLNGTLKIGSLKENTYLPTNDLDLKINLKDSTDNIVKIPEGAQVVINNNYYQVKDGQVICKLLDNLSTSTMQQSLDINLDMSNILPQDRITKGDYKIEVEYLNSKQYEKLTENNISIISKQTEYGVSTDINLINGIENTQIQLISGSQEENRSIKVKYSNLSELNNMKIKIKAVERTGEFEYKETANSKNKIDIDTTELNVVDEKDVEQNINITFKKELQKGTYRILVELYDEFGELRTSDYVNFIVD